MRLNGELEVMVGFYVDATPIKKKEEEAKEAYELLREIIRNKPGYAIFFGADGLIKYANLNAKLVSDEKEFFISVSTHPISVGGKFVG